MNRTNNMSKTKRQHMRKLSDSFLFISGNVTQYDNVSGEVEFNVENHYNNIFISHIIIQYMQ